MSQSSEVIARHKKYMFPAVTPYFGEDAVVISHAKDQYVWDVEGNKYLDFFGGVLTVSIGHCNEEVNARIIEQLNKVQHTSTLYVNEIMVNLAEKVAEITPGRLQMCYFTNSGTEANETAIMAARMYTGQRDIIALRHAYSGRSMTAMSLSGHGTWRLGGVVDPHVRHVRSPYAYRAPKGMSEEAFLDFLVEDFQEVLATTTNGKIAGFIAETIQGVGGFIVPPAEYFKRVIPLVKAAGGVFICDEVQAGWGRTGKYMNGIEHWGVEPDIMTFAKGMANGAPIGCTIATPEIAAAVQGLTFATFGGNPVTMAAALATIEYIEKHNLVDNADVQGTTFRKNLEDLQSEFNFIGDVRGMGLMQAMEIIVPGTDKQPDAARATAITVAARKHGLMIGKGGLYGNIVRMSPHLNVSAEDMEDGCQRLAKALADVG